MNLVRRSLKETGGATKRRLAESTGLSIVTVGTVLQHLVSQGEVLEAEFTPSNGGRPAKRYTYNDRFALALILFPFERQGSIYVHQIVVTLSGERLEENEERVDQVDLALFERLIDRALADNPAIQAIGLGLPGAEFEGKMIVSDYDALRGISVTEHLMKRYRKPVVIENDVNAAAIGFSKKRKSGPDSSSVYFYFPDRFPPGAGIFINGKLYKGRRNFAGEVAHIPIGIPWGAAALPASFDRICEAIAKLIMSVCSVLNPDFVVLYGSFIKREHIETIARICGESLPASALPEIFLSGSFEVDYVNGMITQTLQTLEPTLVLTRLEN